MRNTCMRWVSEWLSEDSWLALLQHSLAVVSSPAIMSRSDVLTALRWIDTSRSTQYTHQQWQLQASWTLVPDSRWQGEANSANSWMLRRGRCQFPLAILRLLLWQQRLNSACKILLKLEILLRGTQIDLDWTKMCKHRQLSFGATSHIWMVCVEHTNELCKTAKLIKMPFWWGQTCVGQGIFLRWGPDPPPQKGALLREHMPVHCKI